MVTELGEVPLDHCRYLNQNHAPPVFCAREIAECFAPQLALQGDHLDRRERARGRGECHPRQEEAWRCKDGVPAKLLWCKIKAINSQPLPL